MPYKTRRMPNKGKVANTNLNLLVFYFFQDSTNKVAQCKKKNELGIKTSYRNTNNLNTFSFVGMEDTFQFNS